MKVNKSLTQGKPKSQTAPTLLVAPFYGVDQNNKRSGYSDGFVQAVRHLEYPQFLWDKLPVSGTSESILRLDHLQPIGAHYASYTFTNYTLSDDALSILDEMLEWLVFRGLAEEFLEDSFLKMYRDSIEETFGK